MQQTLSKNNFQGSGSSPVSDHDRLGFTIVMALALHVLIIFGLGFDSLLPDISTKFLEVTLTQFKNDEAPKKSDFVAQYHQEGSGTLANKAQLTTDEKTIYQDNIVRKIQLNVPSVVKTDPIKQKKVISTAISEQDIYAQNNKKLRDLQHLEKASAEQLERQNLEIASLEAKLNQQKQLFAKAPKIRQITSVSAKASSDAAYINSFREKIEYVGNKYYPYEAKVKNYQGDVQLLVSVKQDGYIRSIQILRSSNNPVLDKAAINSVRLAAPFPRFTKQMRQNTDILEIIRTWQFRSEGLKTNS